MRRMNGSGRRHSTLWVLLLCAGAAQAYYPPVETRQGVRVAVESFPQTLDRTGSNPYSWPLGVTEVPAGAPRSFPVVLSNETDRVVSGALDVWMNDDWEVAGPNGSVTLQPREGRSFTFTGTSKPRALDALYPVHARFTPHGVKPADAPHPIAIFRFRNPNAPRAVEEVQPPRLKAGAFELERAFKRSSFVEVAGKVHELPSNGSAEKVWGGGMTSGQMMVDGTLKSGFHSHPPYKTGPGHLWSDFPLELPEIRPLAFRCSNFLVDHYDQPASDGVDYKVFVLEEGRPAQLVCSQNIKKILTWFDMSADLTPWAGRKITLRLFTGPGPQMNTCCDGGGWGEPRLLIGEQPKEPTEAEWTARTARALELARTARENGTDSAAGGWKLEAEDGSVYGAGVVKGRRGLIDGVIAFTDGGKSLAFRGFTARVDTPNGESTPDPVASIRAERGTLRISWSIPGLTQNERGFPRIGLLSVGPSTERPHRVYAGFGNVLEGPKRFVLGQSGFGLSTRHVGADYGNGFSVVQAVDVIPDRLVCEGDRNLFALQAHHNATFTFAPSTKGAFRAARQFRAVAGYRVSPGHAKLGSRMCLDEWSGDYGAAARGIERAAKYGLTDAIFVKHDWQRWGYDYRLPEIFPPHGNPARFGAMREACRRAGILFAPHDNYTDIYPDAESFSYDLTVFNLDGTPQLAWFNPGVHAQSYRWAPHAFHPWCLRNARLLKQAYDPDAIFIDVLTAHPPFDYLDRSGRFHSLMETSAAWARGFATYRAGFERPDTVCVSEAGQDHLVGCADAGQSDHHSAVRWFGRSLPCADADRTPWHDIVTHGYYVLFAGGLGSRYMEDEWNVGGDADLHGYASDDYLANGIIGGRNLMCHGPFNREAVMTYWLQHDASAALGRAEFLDLTYEGSIHRQHAVFSDGGEVWINRETNAVWTLPNGIRLPSYGSYVKTARGECGVVLKGDRRCAFSRSEKSRFYDARMPSLDKRRFVTARAVGATASEPNRVRVKLDWETHVPVDDYQVFVHVVKPSPNGGDGIVFQCGTTLTKEMRLKPGRYPIEIDVRVPNDLSAGIYEIRYGMWNQKNGARLSISGDPVDKTIRARGGEIEVKNPCGRVTEVAWHPNVGLTGGEEARRDRLLGINRTGAEVDFGDVRTNGSFRYADGVITPLPRSDAFTATLDLAALGVDGKVVAIEMIDPQVGAAEPKWSQRGNLLTLAADSKSFAYRIRTAEKGAKLTGEN